MIKMFDFYWYPSKSINVPNFYINMIYFYNYIKLINVHLFIKIYTLVCFSVNLCSHYFYDFQKKGPRPKWTTYKHESDNNKKYPTVGNFGILYVYNAYTAYTSLYRCLKYLLKIQNFIQNYLNIASFWF